MIRILLAMLSVFIWPGDRFCQQIGVSPREDSGMLRGFVNSVVWGAVISILLWQLL